MTTSQNLATQILSARQVLEIRQSYSSDTGDLVDDLRRFLISAFEAAAETDLGRRLADRFVPVGRRFSKSSATALAKIETALISGASIALVAEELFRGDLGL